MLHGGHLIAHWTRMQNVVSTSSAEAELIAAYTSMKELVSIENMSADLQSPWKGRLKVDARACRDIILRKGTGKLKHVTINYLWIQYAVQARATEVVYVPRHLNIADLFTHGVSESELCPVLSFMACRITRGFSHR